MAEILENQQMLSDTYEPKRKYRWILAIEGIDAFTAKTASRPQFNFGETWIDYINTKRCIAGKMTPSALNITLYDPIVPSASQKVMDWVTLCYEQLTGRAGYAQMYKRTINIKLLDPVGAIVEDWLLEGCFIQDANFNELDYSVDDPCDIAIVLRWDRCTLQF
jgi:hypothetical protein